MAVRVTEANVEAIYQGATYLPAGTVDAHIVTANTLLNDRVQGETGVTEALLTEMEKYLAAHFCILHYEKGGFAKERIDESEDWYQERKGTGLESTWAGAVAVALDPSKKLSAVSKTRAIFKSPDILPTDTKIGP